MPRGVAGKVPAGCHPDRQHAAKGLCGPCYHRTYRQLPLSRAQQTAYARQRQTGWTAEQYAEALKVQGGRCAICDRASGTLHADHDHATGQNRGLLCRACNTALGMLRDSLELLDNASTYLRSYGARSQN